MYPDFNMNNPYFMGDDFNYREDYNYRNPNQVNMNNDEIITFNQALELIRKSVKDEREDELFYDRLIEKAPTDKDKEIITMIKIINIISPIILFTPYFTILISLPSNLQTSSSVISSSHPPAEAACSSLFPRFPP